MSTLAQRFKAARKQSNISVAMLAKSVGLSPQSIYMLESGRMKSTVKIASLAKALGVSPSWLETGKDEAVFPGISLSDCEADLLISFRQLNVQDQESILRITRSLSKSTLTKSL